MAWLSRNNFAPSDFLHSDDLNNLANDDRSWGGDVNGGGHVLSNVILQGVDWDSPVASVFSRVGDILAQAGDYNVAQITGAVPNTLQIITAAGSGLSGGGPLSGNVNLSASVVSVFGRTGAVTLSSSDITAATGVLTSRQIITAPNSGLQGGSNLGGDVTLSVVPDSVNQQVQVLYNGAPKGTRHAINFIPGTNVGLDVQDIQPNNRVDVTISYVSGPGSFLTDPTQQKGDLIVRGISAVSNLLVGNDGQTLVADSTRTLGIKWADVPPYPVVSVFNRTGAVVQAQGDYSAAMVTNAVDASQAYVNPQWIMSLPWAKITNPPNFMTDVMSNKGDIPTRSTTMSQALPVGADGQILTADSTKAVGIAWANPPGVTTFHGRSGAVSPATGDYSVAQVTGAVASSTLISPGTGLTGGGDLTNPIITLSVLPDSTNQQVQVQTGGYVAGTRRAVNFINGSNVTVSVSDNKNTNCVDVTVSAAGAGIGFVDPTTQVGDLIVRGQTVPNRLQVGSNGQVLTADSNQLLGVGWVTMTASQTPWQQDIDAAGKNLNNVSNIGVAHAAIPTTAQIYVNTTTANLDGLQVVNAVSAQYASLSVANNSGHSLRLLSQGSAYSTNPDTQAVSADTHLRLLADGAEVMRLSSGHVLIGTTTDDGVNLLQVNGKIKTFSGGIVFPDNTVQTTAAPTATGVTSFNTRTGPVMPATGDYTAALVTNAVDSSGSYTDPGWLNISWGKITGKPSASSFQTPWLGPEDAASYALSNLKALGIGQAASTTPIATLTSGLNSYHLIAKESSATSWCGISLQNDSGSNIGMLTAYGSAYAATASWQNCAALFSNLHLILGSAGNVEIMRITYAGNVGIGKVIPNYKVDVSGDVNVTGTYRVNGTPFVASQTPWSTDIDGNGKRLTNPSVIAIGTSTPNAASAFEVASYQKWASFLNSAATQMPPNKMGVFIGANYSNGTAEGDICFNNGGTTTGSGVLVFADTSNNVWTERMRIHTGGDVGIGTSSPLVPLHIYRAQAGVLTTIGIDNDGGGAGSGQGIDFRYYSLGLLGGIYHQSTASDWRMRFKVWNNAAPAEWLTIVGSNGYIGINNTNPGYMLNVNHSAVLGSGAGNTLPLVQIYHNNGSGSYLNISGYRPVAGTGWGTASTRIQQVIDVTNMSYIDFNPGGGSNAMAFGNGNTEQIRIDSSGHMGIGTTTPTELLTVNGCIRATASFSVYAANTTNLDNAGNMGRILLTGGAGTYIPFQMWLGTSTGSWTVPFIVNTTGVSMGSGVSQTLGFPLLVRCGAGLDIVMDGAGGFASIRGINDDNSAAIPLRIGALNPTALNYIVHSSWTYLGPAGAAPGHWLQMASDDAWKPNGGSWSNSSDIRTKRNVRPFEGGLDIIRQLEPIVGEYNGLADTPEGTRVVSFDTAKLRAFLPECVPAYRGKLHPDDAEETEILGINIHEIHFHMLRAIQQLDARLAKLNA